MARTAPAPNIPPIPGMNPCTWLAGGGGGAGGSGAGGGGGGSGKGSADGKGGKADPGDGGKSACGADAGSDGGGCPNHHDGVKTSGAVAKGDPVDVVTGRVFTFPVLHVDFGGPLRLKIASAYSSGARGRNAGLGHGWGHSLAWEVVERHHKAVVVSHDGAEVAFAKGEIGEGVVGEHGWILARTHNGYALSRPDYTELLFEEAAPADGKNRYLLSAIEDSSSNRIALRYRQGKLVEVTDCVGRVVKLVIGSDGNVAAFVTGDPDSGSQPVTLATFRHDSENNLIAATDADGFTTTYGYDDRHLLTSQTLPTGFVFFYRYDRNGRCVETWGERPGQRDAGLADDVPEFLQDEQSRAKGMYHLKLAYYPDGYSEVDDSRGVNRYFASAFGTCAKAVSAGAVFEREFDENGHLVRFVDPLGAVTTFERDYRGRATCIVDPLGRTTILRRNADGSLNEVIDAAGGVTKITQSANLLEWTDPMGATFSVKYGARGLVEETVSPNGMRRHYRHDDHGNLVEIAGPQGPILETRYDFWGRPSSFREADGAVSSVAYSRAGRIVAFGEANGSSTSYEYDGIGNPIAINAPGGRVTRMAYGGSNCLCEVVRPDGSVVRMKYDREGDLVQVHNPRGEVHRIRRDALGVPLEEQAFDGSIRRYKYDALGQLTAVTNGSGEKTSYERDAAGQLTTREYDDGSVESFEYDMRGDVMFASGPGGEFRFTRNPVGWITGETQDVGGERVSVEVEYDIMGDSIARRTSLGHSVSIVRDELGHPSQMILDGTEKIAFEHDAVGREISRALSGGGRIVTKYDSMGYLAERRVHTVREPSRVGADEPEWIGASMPGVTLHRAYQYTPARELAEVWDSVQGVKRFHYDPLGRLLATVPESVKGEVFSYDAGGNVSGGDRERVYGRGDRLLRAGDEEFRWDDEGRLLERSRTTASGAREVTRYAWLANGLLGTVEMPNGTVVEFSYDCWARRVSKRVSQRLPSGDLREVSTTRFVWEGFKPIQEITRALDGEAPSVTELRYLFETRRTVPVAQREIRKGPGGESAGEWLHYVTDDSGAPEALIRGDGSVACQLSWTAWGEVRFDAGATAKTPFRFRGQYADPETGLSYNRFRYYDPSLGRYISADPIGLMGGLNSFAYAENCPTSSVDVEGLATILSVVRDKDGNIVASSLNQQETAGAFNTGKPCAEMGVLTKMSKDLGSDEAVIKKFKDDGHTMETFELKNAGQTSSTLKALEKGKPLPPGVRPVNPCGRCAAKLKEVGIADQVIAPNNKTDGSTKPWNQVSTWGSS